MLPINTENAPAAIGPYSQAVILPEQNLVYTAGQLGINPQTGEFAGNTIQEQTHQALENIKAVLAEADASLHTVIKTTVFLKDMNTFADMNAVYADFFNEPYPARSAVEVARLPKDALVEIEVIATRKG